MDRKFNKQKKHRKRDHRMVTNNSSVGSTVEPVQPTVATAVQDSSNISVGYKLSNNNNINTTTNDNTIGNTKKRETAWKQSSEELLSKQEDILLFPPTKIDTYLQRSNQSLLIRRILKCKSILAITLPSDNNEDQQTSNVARTSMNSVIILDHTNMYCMNAPPEK